MNRRRPLAGVDLAHKKFKVSETQLKLFFTQPTKHTKRGAQNRDKHTCTTQMPADDDGLQVGRGCESGIRIRIGTGGQGSSFQGLQALPREMPRKSEWQREGKEETEAAA